MKTKVITLLIALAGVVTVQAQEFKGIATYETKITLPDQLPDEEMNKLDDATSKMIEEAMESALHRTYTLTFDKTSSLYVQEKKLEPVNPSLSVSISISSSDDGVLYKNIKENKEVMATTLFEKEFLVNDALHKYDWKLEPETKKIGNYTCYKATAILKAVDTEEVKGLLKEKPKDTKITVWYTPEIAVGHGPSFYWGLPGLIMEANDEHITMLCSKIVLNSKDKKEIKAPKNGEKVTMDEFQKITVKKMKEFEAAHGDDNGKMIIMGG